MNKKEIEKKLEKNMGILIAGVLVIGILIIILFLIRECDKQIEEEKSIIIEERQVIFLTFDQRVAHMKKCFDAAEEITTLGWGKSTGLIAIQLYLDTIDDLSEDKTITLGPYLKSVQERLKND